MFSEMNDRQLVSLQEELISFTIPCACSTGYLMMLFIGLKGKMFLRQIGIDAIRRKVDLGDNNLESRAFEKIKQLPTEATRIRNGHLTPAFPVTKIDKNQLVAHEMTHVLLAPLREFCFKLLEELPADSAKIYWNWFHAVDELLTTHVADVLLDAAQEINLKRVQSN